MKDLREVENFGMTSHAFQSGDLKMVKVRRGKRGHRQSRSLVFRISRSSKPISDDSGVKCNSNDEENSSADVQTQPSIRELKIRIPKCVLRNTTEKKETEGSIECTPPEHQVLQNSEKLKMNTHEDVFGSKIVTPSATVNDMNLHETELRSNRSILCTNSSILNDASKKTTIQMDETKSSELRRSSRRLVLRVQKGCQPNYAIKESSNGSHNFSFGSSNSNEQQVLLGEKRKRGRKPGVRASECCKKRKYGRRGRPPKSPFPKQLNLLKHVSEEGHNEKMMYVTPPKNSVWTLVPKELFESEFFKSQLLKVRLQNSSEEGIKRNFVPISLSSPRLSQISAAQASGSKQAKIPVIGVNHAPAIPEKTTQEKDPKRPTVIYFKTEKKKFDCSRNQRREFRNPQLQNAVSKTENDMLYLLNKYRVLENTILKNYYELAGGNLNEAENMLSNFLSNNSDVSQVKKVPSICEPQVNSSHYSVCDLSATSHPVADSLLRSLEPILEDPYPSIFRSTFRDTLSRKIIIQSLQILYSEEAVLG